MTYERGQKWTSPSGANTLEILLISALGDNALVRSPGNRETWISVTALDGWTPVSEAPLSSEVRVTDPVTGGQKGTKPEEYALIPAKPLASMARVYGMGAKKYAAWNWAKGYDWNLSLSALMRHLELWRGGENTDAESGESHLAHVMFHCATLMEFQRLGLGTDGRWTK